MGIEEKLDAILAVIQGSSNKKFQATRKAMYSSMFHTPIEKGPKPRGRNEILVSDKLVDS